MINQFIKFSCIMFIARVLRYAEDATVPLIPTAAARLILLYAGSLPATSFVKIAGPATDSHRF